MFTKCHLPAEQVIASEVAMYLYDARQNLANYAQHNLSSLTWSIIQKLWLSTLETNAEIVHSRVLEVLESIRDHIVKALGSDAAQYFDDLSADQKKALTDSLIKKNIDLAKIANLKETGEYILYAPYDFLLNLYASCTDDFFNGGVWNLQLNTGADGLLDQDILDHANNKIKQQYRNSLEDVVNFARDKYDDELTLRRVQLSVEFLQKRLVE